MEYDVVLSVQAQTHYPKGFIRIFLISCFLNVICHILLFLHPLGYMKTKKYLIIF